MLDRNSWSKSDADRWPRITRCHLRVILEQYSLAAFIHLHRSLAHSVSFIWHVTEFDCLRRIPWCHPKGNSLLRLRADRIFTGHTSFQVILNDHPLNDIRQDAVELYNISDYHGHPCQPNPCTLNEICRQNDLNNYTCHIRSSQGQTKDMSVDLDGRINLVYPYAPSNLNRNYFKLAVRTKNSFGLIFYIGDTTSVFSQYLSLTLVNGFVQFTAKIDRNASEIFLVSKVRVDDGQWHRIELERFVHRANEQK